MRERSLYSFPVRIEPVDALFFKGTGMSFDKLSRTVFREGPIAFDL